MNIKIQLICIVVSFLYGIFIKITNLLNSRLNNCKNILIKSIINVLYVYIIVLLYIIIIYKINNGIFHIYFFVVMSIGYLFVSKCVKFTKILQFRLKSNKNK